MNDWPLQGKKIAVLVESEFIPGEIEGYRYGFATLGAEVHFMSRLWGQPSQTFVSDVEHPSETAQTLTVTIDFQTVRLEDYAAVLMAANYTSVRLRYYEPPTGQTLTADGVTTAPAVQFFAAAMVNPRIVKGALCHGLWILTPHPELLKGRRVICHQVVLADVRNCGAEFVAPDQDNGGVVVDRDLVTGHDWHVTRPYVQAIARQIATLPG
ncbi:MAG TPA: DJ-1/PfpI family protein [Candidatus Competibacteraceae bacterium]|nr:DJ-1/PfpI family protein [Candidatus Competibacteraceae bacterium]